MSQYLIAATLFDVLKMFGEDADAFVVDMRKFAKRKGPYIARCLKDGVQPHTGNIDANGNPVASTFKSGGRGPLAGMCVCVCVCVF